MWSLPDALCTSAGCTPAWSKWVMRVWAPIDGCLGLALLGVHGGGLCHSLLWTETCSLKWRRRQEGETGEDVVNDHCLAQGPVELHWSLSCTNHERIGP